MIFSKFKAIIFSSTIFAALTAAPAAANPWVGLSAGSNADGYTNANVALEGAVPIGDNFAVRATAAEDTLSVFATGMIPVGDFNLFAGPGVTLTEEDYWNGDDWHDRAKVSIAGRVGAEYVGDRIVVFGQADAAEREVQLRLGVGYPF